MEAELRRAKTLEGIRKIVDILEAHPELDIPDNLAGFKTHVYNVEDVQKWIKALPGKKDKNFAGDDFSVISDLGLGGYETPKWGYYIPINDLAGDSWAKDVTHEMVANRQKVTYGQSKTLEELEQAEGYWGVVGFETTPYFPVRVSASRESVCEKKVVGKELKTVTKYTGSSYETLEEVEVVEWECNPVLK